MVNNRMRKYQSTKIFENYSVGIRQHKASHSHCNQIHGYALVFEVTFESIEPLEENQLDEMNWIQDFGGFKSLPKGGESVEELKKTGNGLKDWMDYMWDHTMLIEQDDPQLETFQYLEELGLCHLRVMEKIGAESAAKLVFDKFNDVFSKTGGGRVKVVKVQCWESPKNSGIYMEC